MNNKENKRKNYFATFLAVLISCGCTPNLQDKFRATEVEQTLRIPEVIRNPSAIATEKVLIEPSELATNVLSFHRDHLGNMATITDGNGAVLQRSLLGPYGELKKITNAQGVVIAASASATPLLFTGHYYDWESGYHYANARYIDPDTKRFISLDPALYGREPGASFGMLVSSVQATNPYAYVENRTTRMVDPTGGVGRDSGALFNNFRDFVLDVPMAVAGLIEAKNSGNYVGAVLNLAALTPLFPARFAEPAESLTREVSGKLAERFGQLDNITYLDSGSFSNVFNLQNGFLLKVDKIGDDVTNLVSAQNAIAEHIDIAIPVESLTPSSQIQKVAEGIDFDDLSPAAQKAAIGNAVGYAREAMAVIKRLGIKGVQVDASEANFKYDMDGNPIAWFDPVAPKQTQKLSGSSGPAGPAAPAPTPKPTWQQNGFKSERAYDRAVNSAERAMKDAGWKGDWDCSKVTTCTPSN